MEIAFVVVVVVVVVVVYVCVCVRLCVCVFENDLFISSSLMSITYSTTTTSQHHFTKRSRQGNIQQRNIQEFVCFYS
jgi:hypothetical protein